MQDQSLSLYRGVGLLATMEQTDVAAEVELVRSMVGKYFPIYEVKVTYEAMTMLVSPNQATLGADFESLRKDMKAKGYIPFINYSGGEYALSVIRQPEIKRRGGWANRILLAVTFLTTTLAGMVLWADYESAAALFTLDNVVYGALFFALPLMAILGVHELSHYLVAKKHGVEASLPFFIPSIPPLGTFGAFISMRDPMPSRKAMVDIGIAGPLGGLAVTVPVALIGLFLTANGHPISGSVGDGGVMYIAIQPLYQLLALLVPMSGDMAIHPTAFAAWVGFLVTAINLLPVGQLDGGHVARGLFGDKAKYLGYGTFAALAGMALFMYDGWLLFALLVFILGLRHPAPLNDISKLDRKTFAVGALGLLVLVATFVPVPMYTELPTHTFDMSVAGSDNVTVAPGAVYTFTLLVNNTGNTNGTDLSMSVDNITNGWDAFLLLPDDTAGEPANVLHLTMAYQTDATISLEVHVPSDAQSGTVKELYLRAESVDATGELTVTINVA